ncbi:hypothetical protein [Burkholderia cepacia]|uniref:hypothetical protein n=1 Tax=Burkholderia cepacia TaxID=292 RepID=UPI001CF5A517|nr:hypothetical protein [Burkholderia cepacia]MCA8346792.1 hypothetical protein [Burkholderia cepacia]MDO5947052.1 hypothetical protein [Burkholderia cepacia]
MGIIPSNAGGFGNVHDAAEVFNGLEIEQLTAQLREENEDRGGPPDAAEASPPTGPTRSLR